MDTELQERVDTLEASFSTLENRVSFHKHTGADETQKLNLNTVYVGKVVSNAASTPFPVRWTAAQTAAGKYTITHNLGHTNYAPVCTGIGAVSIPSIQSNGSTTFVVWFYSTAGNLQDTDFTFIVSS